MLQAVKSVLLQLILISCAIKCAALKSAWSPQLFLKNSKVISVKDGEERCRLQCPVSFRNLTFSQSAILWLLPNKHEVVTENNGKIGIANGDTKYSFIGLTGDLEINNVSYEDEGIYRCIVMERINQTRNFRTSGVKLIIGKNSRKQLGEKRKEFSNSGSVTRAVTAAVGALLIFTLLLTVHHFRWRKQGSSKLVHVDGYAASNQSVEDGNNFDSENEDRAEDYVKQADTTESSYCTFVNKGFYMNLPSRDKVYILPESSSQPTTSSQSHNQADSNFKIEPSSIGLLAVPSHPTKLNKDDLDGLSSLYPLHNPPFRCSSLQQSRKEKGSQLRIKRWWLNPLPTDAVPGTSNNDESKLNELSTSSITAHPVTCPVTTVTQVDTNDEDDAQLQPHV